MPSNDAFTLADRQLCERVAGHFYAHAAGKVPPQLPPALSDRAAEYANAWADLAARIQRALAGEYTTFTRADCSLIQALHLEVLRHPLVEGAKDRSRALSRLGVLVLQASRGQLAQLQGAGR